MDHGIDFLGDEIQPEELNKIELGKQYGWPHVWGDGGINPQSTPVGDITKEQWKANSVPMTLGYTAHAAPMQMVFNADSSFPEEYRGDAFVAMRGSWNREAPSGYEIVRIHFENGQPKSIEPFVTGFLTDGGKTHIARPVGLAIAKDGSMLMSDDANGVIYRIAYTGGAATIAATPQAAVPAQAMESQASKGLGVPLAKCAPADGGEGGRCVDQAYLIDHSGQWHDPKEAQRLCRRHFAAPRMVAGQGREILCHHRRGPRRQADQAIRVLGGLEHSSRCDEAAGGLAGAAAPHRSGGSPPGQDQQGQCWLLRASSAGWRQAASLSLPNPGARYSIGCAARFRPRHGAGGR